MTSEQITYEFIGDTGWGFVVQGSDGYHFSWVGENQVAILNPVFEQSNYSYVLGNSGDYIIMSDGRLHYGDKYLDGLLFEKVLPAESGFVGLTFDGVAHVWSHYGNLFTTEENVQTSD